MVIAKSIVDGDSVISQSDDELWGPKSRRFNDGYSLSADVSESASSTSSAATFDHLPAASSSPLDLASGSDSLPPPPPPPPIMLPVVGGKQVISPAEKPDRDRPELNVCAEAELMKDRFRRLLLGEDMSGGGRGVSSALAISTAITNLAASVFGELVKLEPLPPRKKLMWQQEMEWLLCVSDFIVERIPSVQESSGGDSFEIMVTQQRSDLYINLPALKKLDGMLISILEGFQDVDLGILQIDDAEHSRSNYSNLCEETRKRLKQCKECTQQILKAAVAINDSVLSEMEVPRVYLENLPKSAKACLGEILDRYITADRFSPDRLLDYLDDLSSEYSALEIADRIESALHFWRLKNQKKKLNCNPKTGLFWGSTVRGLVSETQKSKLFAHRADTLLKNLKLHFSNLPQTSLDICKIQYNKDVGRSILESYSRVLECLAFNLTARIDDVLNVDDPTKQRAMAESRSMLNSHRRSMGAHVLHDLQPINKLSNKRSSYSSSLTGYPFCYQGRLKRFRRSVSMPASPDIELENLTIS